MHETTPLKSKEPRLRDWNADTLGLDNVILNTWNQKNLDYEIETIKWLTRVNLPVYLEIKRTSITRLKQNEKIKRRLAGMTWNQKNLDYEIETWR